MNAQRIAIVEVSAALSASCAVMHRSAIGERIAHEEGESRPIFVNANDVGVDSEGLARTGSAIARSSRSSAGKAIGDLVELLSWATSQSPRTGNPTKDDLWADEIAATLMRSCPGGTITGIQTTRESAEYPYVSGEIVRVRAQCVRKQKDQAQ